jgi:transposase
MNGYSEDLRRKIASAVERGMSKSRAARTFDVSLSSVKRYMRMFRQGRSLSPGKTPGRRPKIDERSSKLLEEDLKERPFATLQECCDYLRTIAGLKVSRCALCRTIKRMDSTRKKGRASASERDEWVRAAWRVTVAEVLVIPSGWSSSMRWGSIPR